MFTFIVLADSAQQQQQEHHKQTLHEITLEKAKNVAPKQDQSIFAKVTNSGRQLLKGAEAATVRLSTDDLILAEQYLLLGSSTAEKSDTEILNTEGGAKGVLQGLKRGVGVLSEKFKNRYGGTIASTEGTTRANAFKEYLSNETMSQLTAAAINNPNEHKGFINELVTGLESLKKIGLSQRPVIVEQALKPFLEKNNTNLAQLQDDLNGDRHLTLYSNEQIDAAINALRKGFDGRQEQIKAKL